MSTIRRDRGHPPFENGDRTPAEGPRRFADPSATLSIIVPAKDEAENLPTLVEEIVRAFRPLVERTGMGHRLEAFEIIVVDDGSTDATRSVLRGLTRAYPEVRPISLARNVGQSAATIAGFRFARGGWVGMLDADLQNPPDELAKLWDRLPGYDAALGWRETRRDSRSRRWVSRIANRMRNLVLGQSIKDTGCSVRIFPREVALCLPAFHGVHRFFGTLLLREGCQVVQLPVGHRPRARGKSHYHFGNRSLRVVVDLLGVAWLLRRPVLFQAVELDEMSSPPRLAPEAANRERSR